MLRQLLTPEEVARCNEAIDAMADQESLVGSESYSGGSPLMRGTNNIFNRLAGPIAALKPGADADAVAGALHGITESGRGVIPVEELHAALERFELDGWKLQPAQIDALMETAVELCREGGFVPVAGRPHQVSAPDDGLLSVGCSNWRIGGQLEWPQPHCERSGSCSATRGCSRCSTPCSAEAIGSTTARTSPSCATAATDTTCTAVRTSASQRRASWRATSSMPGTILSLVLLCAGSGSALVRLTPREAGTSSLA